MMKYKLILFNILLYSISITSFTFLKQNSLFLNKIKHIFKHNYELQSINKQIDENNLLSLIDLGPIPVIDREFLIHGWRWHTISVIKDIQRFHNVILKIKQSKIYNLLNIQLIKDCFSFVFNFNLKGLQKVEDEIFFPWLKELLPNAATTLLDHIKSKQDNIKTISSEIFNLCDSLDQDIDNIVLINMKLDKINNLLLDIIDYTKEIQYVQSSIFVPYISAYVPKKEQDRFNRKVISKLGLLDSQIHLVGMAEAIKDDPNELITFQKQIPKFAQLLMPLWKKRFYLPRSICLESNLSYISSDSIIITSDSNIVLADTKVN